MSTCASLRPVAAKYWQVASSTGKKPMVAPYSGAMLAIVARSVTDIAATPAPKNSTNLPTTLALRSISVMVSTMSVAVTPGLAAPVRLHADDVGGEEIHRLAEHRGFGLDAADAPGDDAEAVDHRGVAESVPTSVSG